MAAKIEPLSIPRRWRAWCEECQDGYQGGKPTARKWADKHNEQRHSTEPGADNDH